MKNKKRILCLLCAFILLLSGCAEKTNVESGGAEVSAPNEFPIVKDPITLRVFCPTPVNVADLETNEFTKWMEEKTNVKIAWELVNF